MQKAAREKYMSHIKAGSPEQNILSRNLKAWWVLRFFETLKFSHNIFSVSET